MRYRRRKATQTAAAARAASRSDVPAGGCRVSVDLDLCQGHGVCMAEAPGVFRVDDAERKVVLLQETPDADERARVETAVQHCPTRALTLEES
ncbi:MAG: ferredoxin [Myxococcota bacterium]